MVQATSSRTNQRQYAKSSSFLMAMLLTVLCGAAALCLGYFIHYFAKGHFVHSTQAILETQTLYLETHHAQGQWPSREDQLYLRLPSDGSLPSSLQGIINTAHDNLPTLTEGIVLFDYEQNGSVYAAKVHTLSDGTKVIVAHNITAVANDFAFMKGLGIASIIFVMLVVFIAYLISIFVVDGTNKIAHAATDIIHTGDLSKRIHYSSNWDDLGNMTAVLNLLLDRMETLFHGVRQVSDNIAHDLRTPITRLRNKIAHSAAMADHPEKTSLLAEVDKVLTTFNALLRISRIETEQAKAQFGSLKLPDLLTDVIALYEPLASEKGLRLELDLSPLPTYWGDKDLLFQAFANLLDNAVKYTPTGGVITCSAQVQAPHIIITVADNGPGIPPAERESAFRRFYRGDASRSEEGMGLGLSLVAAVIALHQGQIDITEHTGGGTAIITTL